MLLTLSHSYSTDKVESLSKFFCLFQARMRVEARLNVDDILPYLEERMYELLTDHERKVLNDPSIPNRDKLRKLFKEYLPSKGCDHWKTILQRLYLSFRDCSEDEHPENHYHYLLAKQMAIQGIELTQLFFLEVNLGVTFSACHWSLIHTLVCWSLHPQLAIVS